MSSSPRITADRVRLSKYMIKQTREADVTVKFQEPVRDLVFSSDPELTISGLISEKDGIIRQYNYDLIIDASGIAAIHTQLPGPIGQPLPEHDFFYLQNTAKAGPGTDHSKVINGSAISGKKGYRWISLVDQGVVDAGCCVLSDTVSEKAARNYTDAMLEMLEIRDTPVVSEGGSVIPMTLPIPLLAVSGLAVLGESGGMTAPGNGCGISNGLRAAQMLASTLMQAADFSAASLWTYSKHWLSTQGSENVLRYLPDLNCSEEEIDLLEEHGIFSGSLVNDIQLNHAESFETAYPGLYEKMVAVRRASDALSLHLKEFPPEFQKNSYDNWYQKYQTLNRQLCSSASSKA